MDPTQPGRVPSCEPPGSYSHGPKQKLPKTQNATSGPKQLSTHEHTQRCKVGDDTAARTESRAGSRENFQRQPRRFKQQRQLPGRDSHSGAIEGCSRDHHPECYPELKVKGDRTTNGRGQHHKNTGATRRPQPPSATGSHPPSGSNGNGNGNTSGCKIWLQRNLTWRNQYKGDAAAKPANGHSHKGKESPLTMEDRMFFMGVRDRPEEIEEPSQPSPSPAVQAPSVSMGLTISGFMTYPQTREYHDPARTSGVLLVAVNPDPGSKAERVCDEAERGQRPSSISRGSSPSRSSSNGSDVGRLHPKRFLRMF